MARSQRDRPPRVCRWPSSPGPAAASVARSPSGSARRVTGSPSPPAAPTSSRRRQLSAPARPSCVPGDITDPAASRTCSRGVEREWGPVEVLVANAGAGVSASVAKTTDEEWQRMLDLNLTAPFRCLRRALPAMVERGPAGSSSSPRWRPRSASPTSRPTRRASTASSAWSGRPPPRWRRTGVTVNAVCPGYVDTPDDRRHRRAASSPRPGARRGGPQRPSRRSSRSGGSSLPTRWPRRSAVRAQRRPSPARASTSTAEPSSHDAPDRRSTTSTPRSSARRAASATPWSASGRTVFLAGQTALDADGEVVGDGVVEQFEQALPTC